MAKNNKLINAVRQTMIMCKQDVYTKEMMASFALALKFNTDLEDDDIAGLLSGVQEVWDTAVRNGVNVLVWCKDETGIDIERKRDGGEEN